MSNLLYIVGAGGLGKEVKAMISQMPSWEVAGFYDDAVLPTTTIEDLPCFGSIQNLLEVDKVTFVVLAFGDPRLKECIAEKLSRNKNIVFPSLIHPRAVLLNETAIKVGMGCIIAAGAVLTTSIQIGDFTLLNINVTVGHDANIGRYCSIMPGANIAGHVKIGTAVLIGSGASVLNNHTVASYATVGSGAVVTKDVAEGTTVIGVPAKVL